MKLLLSVWIALCAAQPASAATKVGQLAPIFVMSTLDDQDFNLTLLRGKVVLINYWATWCPPCVREQKLLNKIYTRFHSQGLEMIGVSQDAKEDRAKVTKAKQNIPYAIAMGDDAKVNDFTDPDTLPTSFLIGRDGFLRQVFTNDQHELSEKELSSAIKALLAKH